VVLGLAVPKSPSSIMGQLFLLAPGVLHPVQLPFPVGILLPELQRNFGHPVPVTFGTYNFSTWVFGAVNFGTLNVNFGTCHVRCMTDQLRYISVSVHSATMTDIPSCCVLDSRHSQADLLLLKAYVEGRSRHILFMGTHCCCRYSFQYLRCCACCLTYK